MLPEIQPLADAHTLLARVKQAGLALVLASSGPADQVEHYVRLLGARGLVDAWTSAADADRREPAPDLFKVALAKHGRRRPVMVGDSTWDCLAAARAGLPSLAVRTGGFSADELRQAGAEDVLDSLADLQRVLVA